MRRQVRSTPQKVGDVVLAVLAVAVGAIVVRLVITFHWTPRTVALANGEALYYPSSAIWIIAGIGAAFVGTGLRLGLDRQYYNWLLVAIGVGVLTLGTTYAARERVVITADELAVRRWWGFESHTWRYDDLQSITVITHHRRKAQRWVTARIEPRTDAPVREYDVPRLLGEAQLTLQTHARAKGVAVNYTLESRR